MARFRLLIIAGALLAAYAAATAEQVAPMAQVGIYFLDQFGPTGDSEQAEAAFDQAAQTIKSAGGGVLIIPASAAKDWTFSNNNQTTVREPAEPAPSNQGWSFSSGVTVVDTRGGTVKIHPPQLTGMQISRTFQLPEGQSSPHWQYHPLLSVDNHIVRGSTSYLDYLQEDVAKGPSQRFYLPSLRGIFPGMFVNAHTGQGYGGSVQRLYVQELGFDAEKNMGYFLAATEADHAKGAIIHNKTHVNAMKLETFAHTENQTFDFMNIRHHYSQGDTYMFDAQFDYMGNIHSAAGDENGVLYAAFTEGATNIFRAQIESVAPDSDRVVFTSATNANTLGTGRPLINLNPDKWISQGTVIIVSPASWWETSADNPSLQDPVFEGKTYPTIAALNERTGITELRMGGLIRASADAPWTAEIVGRYFAVDEPDERVEGSLRRWYRITSFQANDDGTKQVTIERFWWGSKRGGAPTLYNLDNYSHDGRLKPLKYVIAPGSNVYDVSGGVLDVSTGQPHNPNPRSTVGLPAPAQGTPLPGTRTWQRTLLVAPYSDRGSDFDFAAGDPIEQAIGADPFHPIALRAWAFDKVPGTFPAPMIDIQNGGKVSRASAISVAGGDKNGQPAWNSVVRVDGRAGHVIDVRGEVTGAAVRVSQPAKNIPMIWLYDAPGNGGKKEARLTVDKDSGVLHFDGNGLSTAGLTMAGGISATDTPARNLRGINVPVPAGSTTFFVKFPRAEVDADYAVFLETNWLSQRAVTELKPDGFTVTFAAAAPENARLHWTLVR